MHYKQDYVSYWLGRGDYGRIRVERMRKRKQKRAEKMLFNCRCGHNRKVRPHTCPYNEDIHGDSYTLCTCCSECENNCAGDI